MPHIDENYHGDNLSQSGNNNYDITISSNVENNVYNPAPTFNYKENELQKNNFEGNMSSNDSNDLKSQRKLSSGDMGIAPLPIQ